MPTPATSSVAQAVATHNRGRDPERLAMKYAKMAQSPFIFLRGACHLFYAALPKAGPFREAPTAWACGDLHFENFGSYKGDNRQVYFDINDYDEAALAPCTWDLVRLLTSLACGADELHTDEKQSRTLIQACVAAYRQALAQGKPLWMERETAEGLVRELLDGLEQRSRAEFLDKRTERHGHQRHLRIDGEKALAASPEQRTLVTDFLATLSAPASHPDFYKVLDVARRIAGTGSLGVERYVVLVEGKGSPDGNYLLDLKEALPSCLVPYLAPLGLTQPAWAREGERVVAVQKRMQAVDHAFLQAVELGGKSFLLKGLQPREDRVDMAAWGHKLARLEEVAATLGRLLAWDQLRASGHQNAATADALMAFARQDDWADTLAHSARDMTRITREQWQEFRDAWQAGQLKPDGAAGGQD
ncbi:DUF2252 domain-containing protein [Azospira inquinata]|uniref:DUF2252 domain-containing protein n=1 Tax=Azospira inquinata TaxID=2785627 RepID=A0A975SLC5_9RHOO|nr:DUF2252 domain-containing protein [Azospira inquinata]QWT46208.1 DUF2252 domain-containing protein [Azospira inquinata]QWT48463.1 DUF2252 domain-containing protein [Azospira inquinata]